MKALAKKYWPSLVHLATVAVLFLDSSVQAYAVSHKGSAAAILLVWGWALHWATSPKDSTGSKF